MKLSVLIATVPPRKSQLSRLLNRLEPQLTDEVEVLIYDGWTPFGDKVNEMRKLAKGDFSIVIDDDDTVVEGFIETTLPYLTDEIDYLSYGISFYDEGIHSSDIYQNEPHHKCMIRNSIAREIPLGNSYHADKSWSNQAHLIIKKRTELRIPLYIYDYSADGTVGTEPHHANAERQKNIGVYAYDARNYTWL